MVNHFDAAILTYLNHFARRSYAFDTAVVLSSNYLLRAAGIVPLYWWAWFDDKQRKPANRNTLIFGMVSCVFALLLSRAISAVLPFRPRPIYNPEVHFQAPYSQGTQMLIGWSSSPSDHAVVYLTLAICLYFASRRLGIFALCWAIFVTSLPRVYLGLHYPTDILGGALLGIGVASLSKNSVLCSMLTQRVMSCHERYPGPFYAVFFIFSVQVATAFESVLLFKDYTKAVIRHALQILL